MVKVSAPVPVAVVALTIWQSLGSHNLRSDTLDARETERSVGSARHKGT